MKRVRRIQSIKIFFDIIVVVAALFLAWFIRSQFEFFLYDIRKFSFLFPWVLALRVFVNIFFGLYANVLFNQFDIVRVCKYNLITSVIVICLRLFSQVNVLSMPLSMIFMEYVFSTFGFIIIRLFIHNRIIKADKYSIGHKKRVILWGEIFDIVKKIKGFETFQNKNKIKITGIINSNPFYWDSEFKNIRIYGDNRKLPPILANNDSISALLIINPYMVTKKTALSLQEQTEKLNLELYVLEKDTMKNINSKELLYYTNNM